MTDRMKAMNKKEQVISDLPMLCPEGDSNARPHP
jgi:hypothetical protein